MSEDKPDPKKDRQDRLNEALRANLRKRKAQTRARKPAPSGPDADPKSPQKDA